MFMGKHNLVTLHIYIAHPKIDNVSSSLSYQKK